jgi:predicted DNA-binding transcriptional regulator YafY
LEITARALAKELKVSERTICHDIADLQASGVPIDGAASGL